MWDQLKGVTSFKRFCSQDANGKIAVEQERGNVGIQ